MIIAFGIPPVRRPIAVEELDNLRDEEQISLPRGVRLQQDRMLTSKVIGIVQLRATLSCGHSVTCYVG